MDEVFSFADDAPALIRASHSIRRANPDVIRHSEVAGAVMSPAQLPEWEDYDDEV